MKKIIWKSFVFLFLLLGAANYLIYLNTGRVAAQDWWAQLLEWKSHAATSAESIATDAKNAGGKLTQLTSKSERKTVTMYKWKDSSGQVHLSDHPVGGATEVSVDTSKILDSTEKMPELTTKPAVEVVETKPSEDAQQNKTPIEKARELNKIMNQRNDALIDAEKEN